MTEKIFSLCCFFWKEGKRTLDSLKKALFADVPREEVLPSLDVLPEYIRTISTMDTEEIEARILPGTVLRGHKERVHYLQNIGEHPVTRFAPSPSGDIHLAHHRILYLNKIIREVRGGRTILRVEDTDPTKRRKEKEIVDLLTDLFLFDEVHLQSERYDIYLKYLSILFSQRKAVYCTCPPEQLQRFRRDVKKCPHVDWNTQGHLEEFLSSRSGIIKVYTFERDPSMFEIVLARFKEGEFSPMMNFCVAIDDYEMGVTFAIRGSDHVSNSKKQVILRKMLDLEERVTFVDLGRVYFEGEALSSTRNLREEECVLTLANFIRRGYSLDLLERFWESKGFSANRVDLPPLDSFRE